MTKATPARLLTIVIVLLLGLWELLPERYTDITQSQGSTAKVEPLGQPRNWRTENYRIVANGEGSVGTGDLSLKLLDGSGQVLSEKIEIGDNYTPGSPLILGGGLPDLKISAGQVQGQAEYFFSFVAEYLNLGLDLVGGSEIVYEIPLKSLRAVGESQTAQDQFMQNPEKRQIAEIVSLFSKKLNNKGLKEIFVQGMGKDRVLVQLPGLRKSEVDQIKKILETQGKLELKLVVDDPDIITKAREYVERGKELPLKNFPYEFVHSYRTDKYGNREKIVAAALLVETEAHITGQDISAARTGIDPKSLQGGFAVNLSFNLKGTKKFHKLTQIHSRQTLGQNGRRLAIILDDELQSAPELQVPIADGECQITGRFTKTEADVLVAALRAGSMNVKPVLISENTVGPTLGMDSIRSGLNACLIGCSLVLAGMIYYYRALGVIASLALILNTLLMAAAMSFFGGTLTLPGIAGFALSVGMAVDANILIYERLREELGRKQAEKKALATSFDRAFVTIFDSNVTTFITALIMYLVGNSGPVKGFCLSLMIGLCINIFTAVFVTQTLAFWALDRGWLKKFSMSSLLTGNNFDFIGIGKPMRFIFTYLIIAAGIVSIYLKQGDLLDVDFKSGNLLQIHLAKPAPIDQVKAAMAKFGMNATVQRFGDDHGMDYVIRMPELDNEAKTAFHKFLMQESGLVFPTDKDSAIIRDSTVSSIAATEMFLWVGGALVLAMLAILVYILVRFTEFKFGFSACLALAHDVAISVSVLAIVGIEINLTVVAALLTVVGYSINDTIVIFDRLRENIGQQKNYDIVEMARRSMNQTLSRTLLTSLTTLFMVLSLLFVGGGVIKAFAFAMLIGVLTGTYSTLFIALPCLIYLHQRRGQPKQPTAEAGKHKLTESAPQPSPA